MALTKQDNRRSAVIPFTSETYKVLFDSTPTGLFVVDERKRVVDANHLAMDILKYTRKELIGKICHAFICPRRRGNCPVFDCGEEVYNLETVVIRKDGTKVPVLKSCQKIEIEGRLLVLEGFTDIRERKAIEEENRKLQEQLFHAQKMEAIGTLAGGIAHEFRNVLTPIVGYAELLEEVVDERYRKFVDIIKVSAMRGADIANRVVGLSRKIPLSLKTLDLKELLESLMSLLKNLAKNVEIRFSYQSRAKRIVADRGLLEQVFMNLCINAFDAMPEGGQLVIEVKDILDPFFCKYKDGSTARYYQISITDTGSGMDENTKRRIFDPFFTTKGPQGTGLGLFMVYKIIEMHQGCITVLSQKGQGTTFKLYLPAQIDFAQGIKNRPARL
jgi:PAS domain S-box-containing protein